MAETSPQESSCAAKGCEARFFFVFFRYFSIASVKIVARGGGRGVGEGVGGGTGGMMLVEGGLTRH